MQGDSVNVLKNAPIGVVVVDSAGRYLKVNDGAAQLVGLDKTEMLGLLGEG